jgi:hypothetical protein
MGPNCVQHEGHEADAIADRGHRGEGHRKQKTKVQDSNRRCLFLLTSQQQQH